MEGDGGHIKGLVLRQFLGWYEQRHGRAGLLALAERMSASDRLQVDLHVGGYGVLPSRWYPAEVVNAMLDAAVTDIPRAALPALAEDAAEVIIHASIKGLYRMLFRMA